MRFKLSCLTAAVFLALAGCGGDKEKKSATQVAAKINSSEISVHQINAVLSKLQGVPPEAAGKLRMEVLDKLIDQQLAYDQALEKKLDRNPDVMMAVESAKREIVARAYLDQLVAAMPKPGDEELHQYYVDNPALFSRRRIYNLQELSLESRPEILPELKQQLAAGKTLEEIANWLNSKEIKFRANAGARPAEQVALDMLPKLVDYKDGQSGVIEGIKTYMVVRLVASQSAPVDEAAARPKIQQFLLNQRGQKAVEEEIKKLKAAAKIEYQGEFSGTAAPAPSKPAAEVKAVNPNIEKGVAGLK